MTLDQIAAAQQLLVSKNAKGSGVIGEYLPQPSQALIRGKYSDSSAPLTAPWIAMPDGGYPVMNPGTIPTPAISATVWTDVISIIVPNGYDGVFDGVLNKYNGLGFIDGSGDLIWRILVNGQAVRNYDNILIQLGNDSITGKTRIRVKSADVVQFQVTNANLIGAGTQIFCFLGGWYYPNKMS